MVVNTKPVIRGFSTRRPLISQWSLYLDSSPAPVLIVNVNSPETCAFKNPSHLIPTVPPVDPTLETPGGTPDPQSSWIEGSIFRSRSSAGIQEGMGEGGRERGER